MEASRSKGVGGLARPDCVADFVGVVFVRAFAEGGVPDGVGDTGSSILGSIEESAVGRCKTAEG